MPTRFQRHFTPTEANRTLPLVRRVVDDILERGRAMRAIAEEGHESPELRARERSIKIELGDFLRELETIGCHYKDWSFRIGLVDFPGLVDGREVLFCWRSDEERVAWFHGIEDGYAGRQPIPDELLEQPSRPAASASR